MVSDEIRDRSSRLIQFLRELTLLRSSTVRTLNKYNNVIWLTDVPEAEDCFSVYNIPAEERSELWLEVTQPKVPGPPKLPQELVDWIDIKDLQNADLEVPPLKNKTIVSRLVSEDETNEKEEKESDNSIVLELPLVTVRSSISKKRNTGWGARPKFKKETLHLKDYPNLNEIWKSYVETDWKPWAISAKPFAKVQTLYNNLYEIQQNLEKLAETFELLLSVGCISWQTPNGQTVLRHVLTARASMHFDAARGTISISAPSDGLTFVLEQDMLELTERPSSQQRNIIENKLKELNEDFWNTEKVSDLLETFVHAISPRGKYSENIERPIEPDLDPFVSLSPAIVLRQRTDLNFVRLFDEMLNQIDSGQEIPLGIERLVSIIDDENDSSTDLKNVTLDDEEIYFPLPANPDQRKIAQRLRTRQGILVQGPPGTGKSHTISNLICHLLAQGKRILVTSHTPRALTVLRDKFPKEMRALCVSVVGDDSAEARQALEDSVAGITAKHNNWNKLTNSKLITELRQDLNEARKAEQWAINALRGIKEKDTYKYSEKFGRYSGTAQSIANQLLSESEKFTWFEKPFPSIDQEPVLSNIEMRKLLDLLKKFTEEFEARTYLFTLESEKLPNPTEVTELATKMKAAVDWASQLDSLKTHESYAGSTKLTHDVRENFVQKLDEILFLFYQIAKRPEKFAKESAAQIIGDHDRKWKELLNITQELLDQLPKDYRNVCQRMISGIDGMDSNTVKVMATELRDHLFQGGSFGFGPFRKKVIKDTEFIWKNVRVDGKLSSSIPVLEDLISYLEVQIIVRKLKNNWDGIGDSIPDSLIAAIATFHDYCEPLNDGIRLHELMNSFREELSSYPFLIAPKWEKIDSIKLFRDIVASGEAEEELQNCKEKLAEWETKIRAAYTNPKAHPILQVLLNSVTSLDDEQYHSSYEANLKLLKDKEELLEKDLLLKKLRDFSPTFTREFKTSASDDKWNIRCKYFEEAWNWGRASRWISELSDPITFKKLSLDLQKSQSDIREALKSLAVAKAWEHTFDRLSESQRQHLISWSMAVRRIGKGKGKYAEKHRRDARVHMEKCRGAIPAWIMPIHKVVETVRPGTDLFDVIIVDEASQSGPEALFLLYLGKQIVVVGDDKQISPDFVGLDRSSVDALREQYLKGIPHSDAIGVDHSFFDQAKIRYRGKVRLKEHFRCMPEIIQFSNSLCYSSDPLIPLRQYGGGRINPVVKTIHVENGYVDENAAKPVNIPEAEAVIEEVKRICSDPTYSGKTIGIISLLNTSGQAVYIDQELRKILSEAERLERRIRVGDSYMFQGDERDIMLLSMVSPAPPESGKKLRPMTSDKDERRFNVAASRARDQLILVHSVTLNGLGPACVRHKLLSYCMNPTVAMTEFNGMEIAELRRLLTEGYSIKTTPPQPFDSWFEIDVFIRILERGFRAIPQVEMNGYRIDLIVEGLKGRLAVECDGDYWHGPEKYDEDMARQRDLERCGMSFWRIRGSAFYYDPVGSLEELWKTLEQMEILPSVESKEDDLYESSSEIEELMVAEDVV